MRRRDFITLLGSGSAALACPSTVGAQQPSMPVIGVLHIGSPQAYPLLELLRQGLKESGYLEGRNVTRDHCQRSSKD